MNSPIQTILAQAQPELRPHVTKAVGHREHYHFAKVRYEHACLQTKLRKIARKQASKHARFDCAADCELHPLTNIDVINTIINL